MPPRRSARRRSRRADTAAVTDTAAVGEVMPPRRSARRRSGRAGTAAITAAVTDTAADTASEILRDGPPGFRPQPGVSEEERSKQRRASFFDHILNNDEHGRAGQFDGIEIVGSKDILPSLLGVSSLRLWRTPPKNKFREGHRGKSWVVVCNTPFQVWVPPTFRDAVISHLATKIGVVAVPSTNESGVFREQWTFGSFDFLAMIEELKIERVAVKTYGEKASIEWGVAIMRMARIADPDCKISFDVAAAIRPEQAHWMRQEHMVPATEAGFVTLARWVGSAGDSEFQEEYGTGARLYNEPLFVIPQMWYYAGVQDYLPIYGGIQVERIKPNEGHNNQFIQKVNVYNNTHHQLNQVTTMGMESHQFNSVSTARNRLGNFEQHLHHLETMKPKLRIEVRMELPSQLIITTDDLSGNEWITSLSFVWDALLSTWNNLSLVHIPVPFIIRSAKIAMAYARSTSAVPRFAWAFCGRSATKLDKVRRMLATIIFNCCGLSNEYTNKAFTTDFRNVLDMQDAPLRWLAVEMLKFHAAGDRNKICQALQSPDKFVMQRHPSSTVVRQHGLPESLLPGYTMKPMTANEVTFKPPVYITAPSLVAYIDTALCDNNPFRCVFSPLRIDDFFDSNVENSPENEMLLQQIVEDDQLKALLDQLLIVETRTDVKHVYCTMQYYGDPKQRKMFRQTNNPLELIIETWKRIEERNYTRTWAKVLVLKPKKPYKRAGGRLLVKLPQITPAISTGKHVGISILGFRRNKS
mmetsp:Transcript_15486/g.31374  ORF Transcript_15486/g.31374 Transcript_15486/m.31374 type:complete len:752 (+) Transcript_15486:1-2256(+)